MNGAEFLVASLQEQQVTTIFGYPGGAIMPFYDALIDAPFDHILVRHEQGAALAADGYARATGNVGVCVATSGPGATNLVTGLANAYMDSVPLVAITGQVPSAVLGTDAFQEVDVLGLSMPVVKHSFLVRSASELQQAIPQAFEIARSGRPGPVLVDIPKDILSGSLHLEPKKAGKQQSSNSLDMTALASARALLQAAQKPLVYAGGGIALDNCVALFRSFVRQLNIPVVSTLKGLGCLTLQDPQFLGMLGMHGLKAANLAVQECDLLLVLGARFDDRATGKLAEFAPGAKVIHVDLDPGELDKLRTANVGLVATISQVLPQLSMALDIDPWRNYCQRLKSAHAWDYAPPVNGIYAPRLLKNLSTALPESAIVACDVGQHQMWVAQHYNIQHPRHHLSSSGLGTMGYGLPAAIGAQLGRPEATVVAVCGDGSFLMNLQELATVNRYQLPIKILLLDNQCLGLVRQWQELFFEKRFSAVDLSDNPDFSTLAKAFGIPCLCIEKPEEEATAIQAILQTKGPLLVHVAIDPAENVWPLVPPGKANHHMLEGAQV